MRKLRTFTVFAWTLVLLLGAVFAPAGAFAEEPAEQITEIPAEYETLNALLDGLGNDLYRDAWIAMYNGDTFEKGKKNNVAKAVQTMLKDFGEKIQVDGNPGNGTIKSLNAVQKDFGLEQTESLDINGYERLLECLALCKDDPDLTYIVEDRVYYSEGAAYDYMRASALFRNGRYLQAMEAFRSCDYGDASERAEACSQPMPKTGALYRNKDVKGGNTTLCVKVNENAGKGELVKVYDADDVLVSVLFINGAGKANCNIPAGSYRIKAGVGDKWYGLEDSFGPDGYYEVMRFNGYDEYVRFDSGYMYTITINVKPNESKGDGIGSVYEDYSDF